MATFPELFLNLGADINEAKEMTHAMALSGLVARAIWASFRVRASAMKH